MQKYNSTNLSCNFNYIYLVLVPSYLPEDTENIWETNIGIRIIWSTASSTIKQNTMARKCLVFGLGMFRAHIWKNISLGLVGICLALQFRIGHKFALRSRPRTLCLLWVINCCPELNISLLMLQWCTTAYLMPCLFLPVTILVLLNRGKETGTQ